MKIRVHKFTISQYREHLQKLGNDAEYTLVPSTIADINFEGVFLDKNKREIAVPWPVDRPMDAQIEFADQYSSGAFPVEFITRELSRNNLHLIDGGKCH